ncbi:hypothetical protein [Defluviimonas sp. WL0002]|uniref:hypothetical protein n=1 Tax=Albidovulum marisflavi TaxID=2984159 RepID=UPI0021E7D4B5|nr:hypothetical protein [Defluviimonas sp. WL0002]
MNASIGNAGVPAIRIIVVGDSLSHGGAGGATDGATAAGKAWLCYKSDTVTQIGPMSKAYNKLGGWGWHVPFANELYALTGLRTVWVPMGYNGTAVTVEGRSDANWDFAAPLNAGNLTVIPSWAGENRSTILPNSTDALSDLCGLTVTQTWVIEVDSWHEEGALINSATMSSSRVTGSMGDMYDWFAANHGATRLYFVRAGVIGVDQAAVTANEAAYAYPTVRTAQMAAENANIWCCFQNANDVGSPFNTLTVDGNGRWSAGSERYDGTHWSEAYANCVGKTMAYNIAVREGLI